MSHTSTRVDAVLAGITFTAPVELADVLEVHARITAQLAPGERLEVYHRHHDVVVEVRETLKGREQVTYHRVLEVQ